MCQGVGKFAEDRILNGFEGSEEQERRVKTGEPKEPVILPYAKVGLN